MGIIRRNKSVPVQVQRRESPGEPEIVDIPGSVRIPPSQAAGQPHVTQNNIYISTPTAQPLPPSAAPLPPTEIHHHTTVHHISRITERRTGLSFFGVAGLVLGALAWAALYTPSASVFFLPLVAAALGSALLGFFVAILFRQSGSGVPVLALLVAGSACGKSYYDNGGRLQPGIVKAKAIVEQAIQQGEKSLPQSVIPDVTPPSAVNLESARESAAQRMGLDYKSARAAADAARAELKKAQDTESPGSNALIAAEQNSLDADSKLKAIEEKLRSDPAVVAAEKSGK